MTDELHVITYQGLAGVATVEHRMTVGAYLRGYNPEIANGRGLADWTTDPSHALLFASKEEAFECWRQTSKTHPIGPNGKPNRPLTAFTVEIRPLTEEEADVAMKALGLA